MSVAPSAVQQEPVRHYSDVAVALHWVTATFVLIQIWLGFSMGEPPQGGAFD